MHETKILAGASIEAYCSTGFFLLFFRYAHQLLWFAGIRIIKRQSPSCHPIDSGPGRNEASGLLGVWMPYIAPHPDA
jgi:hypothetical protein